MNQFFNINRFSNYLKCMVNINYKRTLITVAGLFILMYLLVLLNLPKSIPAGAPVISTQSGQGIFVFFVIAFVVFVGSGFSAFNNKIDTRNYLAIPVSTFEKYTAEFLIRVVIGFIAVNFLFWLAASLARWTTILLFSVPPEYLTVFNLIDVWKSDILSNVGFIFFILGIMFYFAVRLFFNKNGWIKTVIAQSVIGGIYAVIIIWLGKLFFGSEKTRFPYYFNELSAEVIPHLDLLMNIILITGIVGLALLGYYKLKEKEL